MRTQKLRNQNQLEHYGVEEHPYTDDYKNYAPANSEQEFERHELNHSQDQKPLEMSFSKKNADLEKSKHIVRSKFENTEPARKSTPLSTREMQYRSQEEHQNVELGRITHKEAPSHAETVKSMIDRPIAGVTEDEYNSKDRSLIKSSSRFDESLRNHYDTFKSNVFTSQDCVFTKDQNLISKGDDYVKASQYADGLRNKHRRESNQPEERKTMKRGISTAAAQSRENLKPVSTTKRIRTSGSSRKHNRLGKSYDYNAFKNDSRCKTAAYNSRVNFNDKLAITNIESNINEVIKEGVSLCLFTLQNGLLTSSPPNTRPSTMAQ